MGFKNGSVYPPTSVGPLCTHDPVSFKVQQEPLVCPARSVGGFRCEH